MLSSFLLQFPVANYETRNLLKLASVNLNTSWCFWLNRQRLIMICFTF